MLESEPCRTALGALATETAAFDEVEHACEQNASILERVRAASKAQKTSISALRSALDEADVRAVVSEMVQDIESWYATNRHAQLEAALQTAVTQLECERLNKDDKTADMEDVSAPLLIFLTERKACVSTIDLFTNPKRSLNKNLI